MASGDMPVERSVTHNTTSLLPVSLVTMGASASSGNLRDARATASRTSLAALSKSREGSNSILILELPSRVLELIYLTSLIPDNSSSNRLVTWVSNTPALAPV